MKKLMLMLLPLVITACTTQADKDFVRQPQHYGLYIATVNVQADTGIMVKNAQTGEMLTLKVTHQLHDDLGYVSQSLPAGHYLLEYYSPDGVPTDITPLETPDGYFDVQDGCFNYGGHYEFSVDASGKASYADTTSLKDIEALPENMRRQAVGHDICSAAMGEANQRLAASDAAAQLSL